MTTFTKTQILTAIKHLASGKSADVVAVIMQTTPDKVIEVAKNHGYPDVDKLAWAADILEKNLEKAEALPEKPLATGGQVLRGEAGPELVVPAPAGARVQPHDEWRVLIANGKGHSSKRIQAAADKALDALDRLRTLLREDAEKNSERRKAEAEKAAAKAEVERLEAALKAAKAKLRSPAHKPAEAATPATEGEYACTSCDRTFPTAQGRALHETRTHRSAA